MCYLENTAQDVGCAGNHHGSGTPAALGDVTSDQRCKSAGEVHDGTVGLQIQVIEPALASNVLDFCFLSFFKH